MISLLALRLRKLFEGPIARTTFNSSLMLGLRLIVQAGTLIVLARALGPAQFGAYMALGALAVLLGTLANFGTHLTMLRDITRTPSLRDESLRLALGTTTLCGSVLLCLYGLLCAFWLRPVDAGITVIVCLGVSELVFQPFLLIAAMERYGRGQVIRYQLFLVFPLALRMSMALMVWWLAPAHPLTVFAAWHLMAVVVALGVAVAMAPESWPLPRYWRRPRAVEWRDAAGYAFLNTSASGVSELDKMLAAKLLLAGAAGIYSAASRIITASALPVIAMMLSAMPRLFRESGHDARRLHRWLFASAAGYGMLAGLAIWLLCPLIQSVFGPRYAAMDEVIRWLALGVLPMSLRAAAVNVLTTIDRPWLRVGLELAGWSVIAILALALTPTMGPNGLALAVVCSEYLLAGASWGAVWHSSRASRSRK